MNLEPVNLQPGVPGQIAGSVLPLKRAEELLATLQDVVSARIVADATGGIDAIHVLVLGTSTPKQVVRNIESALMAQLGLRIDHRKVSVATTMKRPAGDGGVKEVEEPREKQSTPAPTVGRALYFEDVEVRRSRAKGMACKVTIRRGKDSFVGEAEGPGSERSRVEIAAQAALAAVSASDGGALKLTLEGAKLIDAFERELVLVGVMVREGRSAVLLTGSCEIRENMETASALAVLNATNRWVEGVR